ncbi:MAG: DUF3159 domain-containing protein [Candidatus Nanopelagicales bacterium]|nr:DUF3159 domain-containing protein [Candidatus Nanopelagicales bacterium]
MTDAPNPEPTPHHVNLPPALEAITEDLREDASIEGTMFSKAIGGWRGIIDSSLPALVFLLVYLLDKTDLKRAVWSAVIAGILIAAWRLFRRQSIQQVLAGFVGVAISAFLAAKTGNAANFFLPGLLINIAYGIAMVVSVLARWPLIGVLVGGATGDISGWRSDDQMRRAYSAATWIWAGAFFLRVFVQVPLYLAGLVGPLGVTKLAMGWPLTLLAGWWTYRLIRPAFAAAKDRAMADRVAPTEASDD